MSNFVPEAHDVSKLIPQNISVPLIEGDRLKAHDEKGKSFRNLDWHLLAESEPDNATWLGIVYHIDKETEWARNLAIPADRAVSDQDRARLFLLVLSDHLAATAERALREGGSGQESNVHRLWRTDYWQTIEADAEPIKDEASLREMLQWIRSDPADAGEFERRYGLALKRKPEDEGIPRNVTSLYSHSWLTGKFYRVLEQHATLKTDPLGLEFGSQTVFTTHDAEQAWECRLVRATVRFHQQPVRPADLGIFERLRSAHDDFARRFADNLLFAAGDDLWLFLPPEASLPLSQVFAPFLERGLYVTAEILQAALQDLHVWKTPEGTKDTLRLLEKERDELIQRNVKIPELLANVETELQKNTARIRTVTTDVSRKPLIERNQLLSRQRGDLQTDQKQMTARLGQIEKEISDLAANAKQPNLTFTSLHPASLAESFEPPLCEICQIRHGREIRFGTRTDFLCEECEEIRRGGFSQRKLADRLERESSEENEEKTAARSRYLWMRIALSAKDMEESVAGMFGQYVDSIPGIDPAKRLPLKTHLRLPALLRDFVEDYHTLLASLGGELMKLDATTLSSNFWVVPLDSGQVVKKVLRNYLDNLRQYFPKFFDGDLVAPCIRLTGSIASAVLPFYEHWRYVQNPQQPINLRVVGSAQLEIELQTAEALLREMESGDYRQQTFLHRVASIERATGSKFMVQSVFMDEESRSDPARGRPVLPAINLYKSGMASAAQILAYYKMTNWR